jgi:hypothetical protein
MYPPNPAWLKKRFGNLKMALAAILTYFTSYSPLIDSPQAWETFCSLRQLFFPKEI